MNKIILYTSPGCGRCATVKAKLKAKEIPFEETHEIEKIANLGFQQLPVMEKDDKFLSFKEALDYIKTI